MVELNILAHTKLQSGKINSCMKISKIIQNIKIIQAVLLPNKESLISLAIYL